MLSEAKARPFCGAPPVADPSEPLVAILFEHRKSNPHERGREREVRTIQ